MAGRIDSGFTLIEMMVVLLLMGISLAVVAPALPRPPHGAEAAARKTARLLEQTRRTAAQHGRNTRIELNLATGAFGVWVEDPFDGRDSLIAAGELLLPGEMAEADPNTGARARVRFDPLGRADGEPIRFRDGGGRSMTVAVDPWTGGVRVARE